MRKNTNELFFQMVALMLAIIMVHAVYVTVVRPNADRIINRAAEVAAAGGDYEVPRTFFVVIKDFEQEACFVLMIWALAIMGYKTRTAMRESRMLEMPLVSLAEGPVSCRATPDNCCGRCNHCPNGSKGICCHGHSALHCCAFRSPHP